MIADAAAVASARLARIHIRGQRVVDETLWWITTFVNSTGIPIKLLVSIITIYENASASHLKFNRIDSAAAVRLHFMFIWTAGLCESASVLRSQCPNVYLLSI